MFGSFTYRWWWWFGFVVDNKHHAKHHYLIKFNFKVLFSYFVWEYLTKIKERKIKNQICEETIDTQKNPFRDRSSSVVHV